MSPRCYCCLICGYRILDDGTHSSSSKWLREFRAIYSTPRGQFISGVGQIVDVYAPVEAPSDPTKRYDDEDYKPEPGLELFVSICWEGSRAFICHEACWKILSKALGSNEFPLRRFLDVCDSVPYDRLIGCLNWAHTYGDIYYFDDMKHYPWDCKLKGPTQSEVLQYAANDPCDIPEMFGLLAATARRPENSIFHHSENDGRMHDCFASLPWEIREGIAIYLPTCDTLNLCRSSKSFLPLLDSQIFWASRFQVGEDREFIFEKRNTAEPRDWLALYRMTSKAESPLGLMNRRRIWNLIQHIIQLMDLYSTEDIKPGIGTDSPFEDESKKIMVTAKVQQPRGAYDDLSVLKAGCKIVQRQYATIPRDLWRISFSFVGMGEKRYLSGLCFQSKSGRDTSLGYLSGEGQVVLDIKALRGFALAINSRGIRALQAINSSGHRSQWLGSPNDTPKTERLSIFDTVKPLEASTDAYKIVGFGAQCLNDDRISPSLRTTAIWYPAVPRSELYLNEEVYKGQIPTMDRYSPIQWVDLGGPKGANLQHLIDISLGCFAYPASIRFNYQQISLIEQAHFGALPTEDEDEFTSHSIDGVRGEYVQTVQVALRDDHPVALKLTTNNGQSFESGTLAPPSETESEAQYETIDIASGTIITGFYAELRLTQFPNFGVVSEGIKRKAETQEEES